MSFASIRFILFFLLILLLLALTNTKFAGNLFSGRLSLLRQIILLAASYIFYGFWDWRFCFLMIGMTLIAYFSAQRIKAGNRAKFFLFAGISGPLLILAIFKYFNFFLDSFCVLFGIAHISALKIILPVGISFYTFQSLSYTIDVSRQKIKAQDSFLKLALYIAFFPQLVAGPIVKAADFLPQLEENRTVSFKNLETGVQLFLIGLFKKIVIADRLSVFVDSVFAVPAAFSAPTVLLAIISYAIQIYFDFSGYSDMAIGCAKCLGYDLRRNFNLPYISKSVREFWKRWHISLSSWLQEYLYISLGGNRKGEGRTYLNLMITMLLGGLWHGANWTFVFWGGMHGIALCVHRIWSSFFKNREKGTSAIVSVLSTVGTFCFVSFCWVVFRAESLSEALQVFGRLVEWTTGITQMYTWSFVAIIFVVFESIIGREKYVAPNNTCGYYLQLDLTKYWSLVILLTFAGLIAGLAYTGGNPFIYFQF